MNCINAIFIELDKLLSALDHKPPIPSINLEYKHIYLNEVDDIVSSMMCIHENTMTMLISKLSGQISLTLICVPNCRRSNWHRCTGRQTQMTLL